MMTREARLWIAVEEQPATKATYNSLEKLGLTLPSSEAGLNLRQFDSLISTLR